MNSRIILHNFKCFQEVEIPISNLTVMAGSNGLGKSTSIQAILLLRSTLEKTCNLEPDDVAYHAQTADLHMSIALNGPYLLALGNSGHIPNREMSADLVTLGIVSDEAEFVCHWHADLREPVLHLSATGQRATGHTETLPLLRREFYYLNAERVGPRSSQGVHHHDFPQAGYQGEYVAQLIAGFNYTLTVDESRRYPAATGPRLEQQTNAWLDYLMPGVRITARQNADTLTAQIQVENQFIKGDPTLATNIGFGISYVLPILVTGLIAPAGSFLIVENPEAHLHPSAQSRIGRFLAMVAAAGVYVVAETHSDHVINGIQVAVAKEEIPADKVMINFFSQQDNQPQPSVDSIRLNTKGELSHWPSGFFDQTQLDLAELFKLRRK